MTRVLPLTFLPLFFPPCHRASLAAFSSTSVGATPLGLPSGALPSFLLLVQFFLCSRFLFAPTGPSPDDAWGSPYCFEFWCLPAISPCVLSPFCSLCSYLPRSIAPSGHLFPALVYSPTRSYFGTAFLLSDACHSWLPLPHILARATSSAPLLLFDSSRLLSRNLLPPSRPRSFSWGFPSRRWFARRAFRLTVAHLAFSSFLCRLSIPALSLPRPLSSH